MSNRISEDLIESLYVTLEKLEQNFPDAQDASAMGELKRVILLRLADLQSEKLMKSAASPFGPPPVDGHAAESKSSETISAQTAPED